MTPEPMEVEAEEEYSALYDDRYCYKERYERYESYESLEERRMQDGREVLSYDAMIGESIVVVSLCGFVGCFFCVVLKF